MKQGIVPVGTGWRRAIRSRGMVTATAILFALFCVGGFLAHWYSSAPVPAGVYPARQYMHITRDWAGGRFALKLLWVKPTPFAVRPPVVRRAELLDRDMNVVLTTPVAVRPEQRYRGFGLRGIEVSVNLPMDALNAVSEPAVFVRLDVDGFQPAVYRIGEIRFAPEPEAPSSGVLEITYERGEGSFGFSTLSNPRDSVITAVRFPSELLPGDFAVETVPKVTVATDEGGSTEQELPWQLPLAVPANARVKVMWQLPASAVEAAKSAFWLYLPDITATDGRLAVTAPYAGSSDWGVGQGAWRFYVTTPEGGSRS